MSDSSDKENSNSFLGPKLGGERFVEHSIPLDVLGDLSAVQDILIQVANDVYKEQHQQMRGPANLRRAVSLQLKEVGEGSAIAHLDLRIGPDVPRADDVRSAISKAKERFITALNAANAGDRDLALEALGSRMLARFEKLGSSLKTGEYVEFSPNAVDQTQRARLDTSSRAFLAGIVRAGAPIEQAVEVRGVVSNISLDELGFDIRNLAGDIVSCDLSGNDDRVTLTEQALKSAKEVNALERVLLTGTGLVAENGSIQSIKEVDSFEILPRHDVLARIEELSYSSPESFESSGALGDGRREWLVKGILSVFNEDTGYPAIFVGPDQDLFLEWQKDSYTVSVEVDTKQEDAEVQIYNSETNSSDFQDHILDDLKGWRNLLAIVESGFFEKSLDEHEN